MGGFGALRLAGKFTTRFAAASAHSAITKFSQMRDFVEEPLSAFTALEEDRSVFDTLQRNHARLPPFRFDCGLEDPLLSANRALHAELIAADIGHTYQEFPGAHAWDYWHTHLADICCFTPFSPIGLVRSQSGKTRATG